MSAEELLKAMEIYGLTLRRLMPKDSKGHERQAGWLVKISGSSFGSTQIWDKGNKVCDSDFFGPSPYEAVEKAVRCIKSKKGGSNE